VIERYRAEFRPSRELGEPEWSVAVAGICATSSCEALRQRALHDNPFLFPTIVGGSQECCAGLLEIGQRCETKEILFVDLCSELEARVRCYELLAAGLGLAESD
jgi:hypothetical protein